MSFDIGQRTAPEQLARQAIGSLKAPWIRDWARHGFAAGGMSPPFCSEHLMALAQAVLDLTRERDEIRKIAEHEIGLRLAAEAALADLQQHHKQAGENAFALQLQTMNRADAAEAAVAEMRDACAKVCDDNSRMFDTASARAGSWIAAANAIRAIPIPLSPAPQE